MTPTEQRPNKLASSLAKQVLLLGAGAVVTLWAVWWSDLVEADGWQHAAAPFVHGEIASVQVLAMLPAAFLLATWWPAVGASRSSQPVYALGAVLAGVAAAYWYVHGLPMAGLPDVPRLVEAAGPTVPWRVLRPLCVLVLLAPWAVAAVAAGSRARAAASDVGLAAAVALLLPGIHTAHVVQGIQDEVQVALEQGIKSDALYGVFRLERLAAKQTIGGDSVRQLRTRLAREIQAHLAAVEAPLPADADLEVRRQRAIDFIAVSNWEQAHATLAAISSDPLAALMQLSVAEQQQDWEAACHHAAIALERLDALAAADANLAAGLGVNYSQVYERWARNLRRLERPLEAEQLLLSALAERPELAGYLHYQLGVHYREGGRSTESVHQFRQAVTYLPGLGPLVEPEIRSLLADTPACLLGLWNRELRSDQLAP